MQRNTAFPEDHLQDHDLAELAGVLTQKASARLAGDTGALGGADAGKHSRKARSQQCQRQTADGSQNGQGLLQFYHLCQISHCSFLLNSCYSVISTYFVSIAKGRNGFPPSS